MAEGNRKYAVQEVRLTNSGASQNHIKVPGGFVLDTKPFHTEINQEFATHDPALLMEESYQAWLRGDSIEVIIKNLDCYLPRELVSYDPNNQEHMETYSDLNNQITKRVVMARQIVDDRLVNIEVEESDLVNPELQENLDEETQTTIAQLQEYAWYLTIVNHRWISKKAMGHRAWKKLEDCQKEEFMQAAFLESWNMACRHDPEKATFVHHIDQTLPLLLNNWLATTYPKRSLEWRERYLGNELQRLYEQALDPEEAVDKRLLEEEVQAVLEQFEPEDRLILKLRFGYDRTLQQIADDLDSSRYVISQKIRRMLRALRKPNNKKGLKEFY